MKKILPTFLALFILLSVNAQTSLEFAKDQGETVKDIPTQFAERITAEDLEALLTVIASDEMQGRETGTEGQRKAADFIAQKFSDLDLPRKGENNSYFQEIAYTAESWLKMKLSVNGVEQKNMRQFYAFPNTNSDMMLDVDEVLFLGYGIDDEKYSDYKGVDVKGKTLLIYYGEPVKKNGVSRLTGTETPSDWSTDFRKKLRAAKKYGAKSVLIIDDKLQKNINENRRFLLSPRMRIGRGEQPEINYANNIFISTETAKAIIGSNFKKVVKARKKIAKKLRAQSVTLPVDLKVTQERKIKQLIGSNVLGYIEGSDPVLKDEIVIISAHYDHLGMRGNSIFNGADDNGSGTSSVLEIAEALTEAKKMGHGPRRTVICMLVSGEEKGLLGSKYYVENPLFPLAKTIVDINVDMVGRTDDKHKDSNYVYVIGSDRLSTELHEINENANNAYTKLKLDYTYNAEDDPNRYYYRSDHYNFAEKGIPAIFFFSGTHADYHRPTDTVEKIEFEKMETIARLVFYTTWELANRDKAIEVDVKP